MTDPAAFRTVIIDTPWPEVGGGNRGADAHYDVIPYNRMAETILRAPCWPAGAADLWVGMWSTVTSDEHASAILRHALGCRLVTRWTWLKTNAGGQLEMGMGQYGRHGAEFILWGKRGRIGKSLDEDRANVRAVFEAPLAEHSAKPQLAYDNMMKVFPGPWTAMFERIQRPGITCWGNELVAA